MKWHPIVETVLVNADKYPDKEAIIFGENIVTYRQLKRNILVAARFLQAQGIKKGDRVVFSGEKSPLFAYIYFATHLLNAIAIPLENKMPESRIIEICRQAEPGLILLNREFQSPKYQYLKLEDIMSADALLSEYVFPDADDTADVLFTSGTTGLSKGVILTHRNILSGAINTNLFIGNDENDIEIIPLPLHHAFGLRRLRTNLMLGATVVLIDGFMFPDLIFKAITKWRCTGLCMVPAGFGVIKRLIRDEYIPYFKKLRYIEFGSATLDRDLKQELIENLPESRICMHYGLTEVAANIFIEFHESAGKMDSLGKPSPNVRVRIANELGESLTTGKTGEIQVAGDMMTAGYWKNEELTKNTRSGEWFRTGDMGYMDEEGYIHLVGRQDDIINVGGKKVAPAEIESLLNNHPGIRESACVGIKQGANITGEKLAAFVVLVNPEDRITTTELVEYMRQHLESYKIPGLIKIVEKIPRTSTGKIRREDLKKS
jgi:long-chain acyl-CoA synthetase